MDWGSPAFVLGIVGIVMLANIIRMSIMAKHGYPLDEDRKMRRMGRRYRRHQRHLFGQDDDGDDDRDPQAARKIELLSSENERLTGQIGRLEERLRVLERIATDPAERTAREIEALRGQD